MKPSLAALVAVVIGLLCFVSGASAELTARPLKRGINLSHWYAQWHDYSEPRLASYITEDDVKLIAQMGFDHVRLTLNDTVVFTKTPGELNRPNIERLKQRIQRFLDADIAVIVDLHPEDDLKKALQTDPGPLAKLATDWSALAAALRDFDPKRVLFEVINEPFPNEGAEWWAMQRRLIEAIRVSAPYHTIIVNPGGWTGADDLVKFKSYVGIDNLLYTFHCYDPHVYTHQSAEWGWVIARRVKDLDWPVEPSQAEAVATKSAGDEEAKRHLKWIIGQGDLTERWLTDKIAAVAKWRKDNGDVPVYMGEFGVYQKAAPLASRLRWLKAVRTACESHQIGWAMWDYAGGFAVVRTDQQTRKREPNEEMLEALGMKP